MRIYLFLANRVVNFLLPLEITGSFSFDENQDEETKLINIEARDGRWVIYSTLDSYIVSNDVKVDNLPLEENNFYMLKRDDKNYLIYVSNLLENNFNAYSYGEHLNLVIGNGNICTLNYNCEFINGEIIKISYQNNQIVLESNNNSLVYINDKVLSSQSYYPVIGDQITIYGLKIIFLSKLLLINNPNGKVVINEAVSNIRRYQLPLGDTNQDIIIKDVDLYDAKDYFSKSPRIRRIIETKKIKLSPPPKLNGMQELPLILTIGPMFTMGISSAVMLINVISQINSGQTTFKDSWTTVVTSSVMLVSMIVWPFLTKMYNKNIKEKRKQETIRRYEQYLDEKREELFNEQKLQKDILIENLISVNDCINIISNKGMNFWDKRIDQNDFLLVRIGMGNELLDVEVEYPEEGFSVDEDELRKKSDKMVEEFKYIHDVPISYSFYDNIVTAIMGVTKEKSIYFTHNVILQLLTFYSYEDLKIVVFTNEENASNWDYIKYLNHNFNNDRSFRFFSSTVESAKSLAEFLDTEVNNRNQKNDKNTEKVTIDKPYYLIVTDDYERIKRYDFMKVLTESDNNLGFSIIILEERLSKLPSKCNNFISLGAGESGILKNSYEKQEQIIFRDEINYNINMMNVVKTLSNVPIEFEEGIKILPDAISFMEMERVGKVEQLNIFNRWHTNDSTTSLKAEIGVDNQGDFMYLDLHEKYHGPHGLIAGTTGSGKSEFIITYILSMCMNFSPDDVAFILIDYKGGGLALAFENKTTGVVLPHLAGTITNLDKAEMDRTLVSIDSEVKRRQRMFNEAREKVGESTIDIYKYQRHYKDGRLDEPIPHLFIICDEFAELKSQQPDFMDNLISVARIGRSLGVHLILATQKPSGVVNDQIWSNSKFKVCLKVQDESDSKEMLKRPDAAHLKQAGRFYLQVGYDEYFALGQSGWCGAKYYPSDKIVKQVDKSINFIDDCGNIIKSAKESNDIRIEAKGEQLAAILNNIVEIAGKLNKRARKLWLDNIPGIILVDNLEKKYNINSVPYNPVAIIGEYDAPENQEQGIVMYNYLNDGNTLVYGRDSSEIEMFFNTLIYSTTKNHTSEEINYYLIDYGSESLRKFQALPHVGGIILADEGDKLQSLIKMLTEELQKRKKLFVDYGGEYSNYIKNSSNKFPVKVVIINNFSSFNDANYKNIENLQELVRDSARYGMIYIFTGNATNSIPGKIGQNFTNTYVYKLKDASDYAMLLNARGKIVPREIDGRGVINLNGLHEFQTASVTSSIDQLNDYLINFITHQKQVNTSKAKKIPILPDFVRVEDIQEMISTLKKVPVGIEKESLDISVVDLINNLGYVITSNKLDNMLVFVKSLLFLLRQIPNTNLMIIDAMNQLMLDNKLFPNYYNNDVEQVLDKINEYIEKLIESKSSVNGTIVIYNLSKFLDNLDDKVKLETLVKCVKKYEKISIVIVDEYKKIKEIQYDKWYDKFFKSSDGLWIGKGVTDQTLLKTNTYNKEMQQPIKNDMGYVFAEGEVVLVKYIDFITKEEEDNGQ